MKIVLAALVLLGLTPALPAGNPPEYLRFFDPAKGFKPAHTNLTEAFLQAAASLEHFGSPEPYLRHMLEEHERIHKLTVGKLGAKAPSALPESLNAEKVEKLIANWNKLSPVLGLDRLAKDVGQDVRLGIRGVWDKGTTAVTLLNEHQQKVLQDMSSGKARAVGFPQLQKRAISELELDKAVIDTTGYDVTRRDAVEFADLANAKFVGLRSRLTKQIPSEKATQVADSVESVFVALANMAHSEIEAAILEWSVK